MGYDVIAIIFSISFLERVLVDIIGFKMLLRRDRSKQGSRA